MQLQRRRLIPGLILILLGIIFLLTQYFEIGPGFVLIVAGLIFLLPYLFTRLYGLLIPGMILLGLGIGLLYERGARADVTVTLGLGLGFIAVFVVDFIMTRRGRWWPLIPGGILTIIGAIETFPDARMWFEKGWPLILIALGLIVLLRDFWKPRSENKVT